MGRLSQQLSGTQMVRCVQETGGLHRGAATGYFSKTNCGGSQEVQECEGIDCPGVGCLTSDFMEAVAGELQWWPADPLDRWAAAMLERVVGEGEASSRSAILKVCVNKDVLGIRCWAE